MLAHRKADVLVLGSNPNVPHSLAAIRSGASGDDFGAFLAQMRLDHFGQGRMVGDRFAEDWDPAAAPSWKRFMRDVIAPLCTDGATDGMAMANYLPWGSRDYATFLHPEHGVPDPALLARMFALAEQLHARILDVLDPEVVVLPLSLARARRPGSVLPSLETLDARPLALPGRQGVSFFVGRVPYGARHRVVAVLPHPSWLCRVSNAHWAIVTEHVSGHLRGARAA